MQTYTNYLSVKPIYLAVVILVPTLSGGLNAVHASDDFEASEIRKIRHISSALLKSRALEKQRIENDLSEQRKLIDALDDNISMLSQQAVDAPDVVKQSQGVANLVMHVQLDANGRVVNKAVQSVHAAKAMASPPVAAVEKRQSGGMKSVGMARERIAAIRKDVEAKLPGRFVFWREQTETDRRHEHIHQLARQLEGELNAMEQQGKVNLRKLNELKKQISLHGMNVHEEQELTPTFITRTRHRK